MQMQKGSEENLNSISDCFSWSFVPQIFKDGQLKISPYSDRVCSPLHPTKKKIYIYISSQSIWLYELFYFNAVLLVTFFFFFMARKFHGSVYGFVNIDYGEIDFTFWNFTLMMLSSLKRVKLIHLFIILVSLYPAQVI